MPRLFRWAILCSLALLTGCYGQAELATLHTGGPGSGGPGGAGGGDGASAYACDTSQFQAITIEDVATDFSTNVYPLMTRQTAGCAACHSSASARVFKLGSNGDETFYLARAGGFFQEKPGSIYDRLTTQVATAKMPQGVDTWTQAEANTVAQVGCELKALDERGVLTPPDEEFPPALLQPYAGAASDYYDTRFVDYPLLKAKVKQVFNDDWVRNSVDQFDKNISLFGGVNYTTNFVPARAATPEFLLGLDALAPDICNKAATNKTGPFVGIDPTASIVDTAAQTTTKLEAENAATKSTGSAITGGWDLYTNGFLADSVTFASSGDYTFVVNARQTAAGPDPAQMEIRLDGNVLTTIDVTATTYTQYSYTATGLAGGPHQLAVAFINDYYDSATGADRNLLVDYYQVTGPLGSGTGTSRKDAALASIGKLYKAMLYRSPSATETNDAYSLLSDLIAIPVSSTSAWSGLCEALVRHPDFLFTRTEALDNATGDDKKSLELAMLAEDVLGRLPTPAELEAYVAGTTTWSQAVDGYLASPDFRSRYFERFRLRTESNGTPLNDEPARLWTYLATTPNTPMQELFTGDYSVDSNFQKIARGSEHGKTGLLTMQGFIKGKQGLPHYNYAARVMTDFMGVIFQVPPEVFDQRATATAASTVDPSSVCFSCHQVLTPLAHQRLKWDDDGNYRTTLDGQPIDDTDRGLVATYPYKGAGIESFSTKAINKEMFIRRTLNAQFEYLMGREMRHDEDERVLYKELWDLNLSSQGSIPAVLAHVLNSSTYRRQ